MSTETIHELFQRTAERLPAHDAISAGGRSVSYRELDETSDRIARTLLSGGAGKGAIVVILAADSSRVIEAILGVLKAGSVFVPLDSRTPEARLAAIAATVAPSWYLAEPDLAGKAVQMAATGGPAKLVLLGPGGLSELPAGRLDLVELSPEPGPSIRVERGRDELCYVYFTSGSTGEPKGIAGRLKGIDHFIRWEIETLSLGEGVRVSQLTSPAFDAYLRDVFVPFTAGGTTCIPPRREPVLSGSGLVEWLVAKRVEVLHCVPSVFRSMLEEAPEGASLPDLRYLLMAGEPLLPVDVGRWVDRFGERTRLVNLYGPSETTMTKLCYFVRPQDRHRKSIPVGKPIRGARAVVLDGLGHPCPDGTMGEIYIRTPYRSLGYFNRPDLTQEVFVPNPLSDDPTDIVYRTGDYGRVLEDGNIEFLGRKDHQVKIRGVRVELAEVEKGLRAHPAVQDAVVVARDGRLRSYVVLSGPVPPGELREHCLRHLPEVMVPGLFVPLDSLPRTLTGKVDRAALPDPGELAAGDTADGSPRTLTEELLAGMWSELLRRDRVRLSDDFFELGGHSLLATRLLARIRAVFGVELDPRELFARPVLAAVAEMIEDLRETGRALAPPLQRRPSGGPAPLSFGQQRLWLLQQLTPASAAYNMPQAIHIEGLLDPAVLRGTLREIVHRHEVLRTTFAGRGGEPVQVVGAAQELAFPVVDLGGLEPADRTGLAREIGRWEMARPFDLESDLLLRAVLLRLSAMEHQLVVTVHHVASDAWSMEILARELVTLYAVFAEGKPSPLPELALQYADFAAWQRDWLQGEVLEHQLGYWRRQLAGAAPVLDLPTDRPRPMLQTYRGLRRSTPIGAGLTEDLRRLSRRRGATLFMTLLAAFQALLGRLAGARDLSVGLPVAGRDRVELEDVVGFFVNTLVIRTDLSGDPDFVGLLDRVRQVALDAHAHQALPFEKLVEELQPQRSLQHSPLFQVMFVLQNAPRGAHEIPGLRLRAVENGSGAAKLDLTLAITELEGGLRCDLEFNTDLFDPATAARMLEQLRVLLAAAAADPEARLSELPVLTPGEQAQLREWNDTGSAGEGADCLHELFEIQARGNPEAVAVEGSGRFLTYRELNERANRLARHLVRLGVGPETLVGVCVERNPEMVLALLGVLKAGGAYVPLDPSYPRERIDLMIEDSGLRWVLTQDRLRTGLPEVIEAVCLDEEGSPVWEESGQSLGRRTDPAGLAYVIYTSGSTGRPKGVQVCHRSVINLLRSLGNRIGAERDTRLMALTSLSFDIAALELFLPLLHGARVDIAERELQADPRALAERLTSSGANLVQATPSTWSLLVGSGWQGSPHLQVLCGGEALPPLLAADLLARCAAVWNVYGPTETTIWSTIWRVDPSRRRVLIGRPVGNTQVHLLDQDLSPVPVGVGGQLYIGGLGVARGYLERPALTAERFVPDPFSSTPGGRLYGTGDLARQLPDGSLEFLGRFDHQVKVRGFRIELGEVEAALAKHPQVKEAVVVARRGTAGDGYLAAYVVGRSQEVPTASELRRFLALSVPDSIVPSAFMPLERFPLTPNGKVDRKALPDPDGSRPRLETVYVAPQGEKERTLAMVWQEALGIEKVGVHDNFFDLGGHSLLLVRVHEMLRARYPELQLLELFMYPTIDALARHLGGDRDRTEAAREAKQLQQRIEGQDRLRKRLERGRQAAAASRNQG